MPIDPIKKLHGDYFIKIFSGKSETELFTALNETLAHVIIDEDDEIKHRIKVAVIEDELLKLVNGHDLLSFYKSKIKPEVLIIRDNTINLSLLLNRYKDIFTKQIKLLAIFSGFPLIYFLISTVIPDSYSQIQLGNALIFGSLTVFCFLWFLTAPFVIYFLLPLVSEIFEVARMLLHSFKYLIAEIKNYVQKHDYH